MKYLIFCLLLISPALAHSQAKGDAVFMSPQGQKDDKQLQEYFTRNHIKAERTASGLYYTIQAKGSGPNIHKRQTTSIMYTGKLLSGKTFDSNIGRNPLMVHAGMGEVIAGMDEGLLLMKSGTRGTIYIPSTIGYGGQAQGPIPANSVLIFEMEITDVR